ncbi:MAG: alpha-2,8-polysialyltransferase family protein [Nitrososphaera sp.]|nr:alpha-2,8-polysialyltransferase family protein [Nitrososphaera sp.]
MHPKKLKRIVTCQGSIQLVAALAAANFRARRHQTHLEYEDYLVIYSLYVPPGQMDDFVSFIQRMAQLLGAWKRIVYISPEQLESFRERTGHWGPAKIFSHLYEIVGTDNANEIYLGKNWQFANRLFMHAYRSAQKICYGDAIGVYFSQQYFLPAESNTPRRRYRTWFSYLRGQLGRAKRKLEILTKMRTALAGIDFDIGYLLLPDAFGESPPMVTIRLDRMDFVALLQKLQILLDSEYIAALRQYTSDSPVCILLASNFSEADRMTRENEIAAYGEFIQSQGVPNNSVLLIKPHPRDDHAKIQRLRSALEGQFAHIIVLSEPNLFFLPFEALFMEVFLTPGQTRDVKILTFSSACLLLEYLFNVRCHIGFGPRITSKFFHETWIENRIKHEFDLTTAVERVRKESYL